VARIVLLDGAATIGGTKLLLEDGEVRLLFDFGCNYATEGTLFRYDPYIKKYASAFEGRFQQMRALGLLPDVPVEGEPYFTRLVKTDQQLDELPEPGVHGLLLTHAHHDHDGNVPFLSPKIPLFATAESLCFFEQKWVNAHVGKDGYLKNRYANNEHWRSERVGHIVLDKGPVTFLEQTRVTPVRVDHSIPGACGFIIDCSDGRSVALSGDFRLHGTLECRKLSERFVERVRERGVDLLVVEGTNIAEYSSELEEGRGGWSVKEYMKTEVALALERGGMVLVGVSGNNIERIDSLFEIARELDARLHLSVYNAGVLERLRQTGAFSRDHVTRHLVGDNVVVYERYDREFEKKFPGDLDRPYARCPIEDYGAGERAAQDRAIMLLYDGDLPLLTKIKPRPGSKYIRSSWEPFNDEQQPDFERLKAWLERFGLSYHHIHASGHVYGAQLKAAIREMNPGRVVPMHTEHQELFADVLPQGRVVMLGQGGSVEV